MQRLVSIYPTQNTYQRSTCEQLCKESGIYPCNCNFKHPDFTPKQDQPISPGMPFYTFKFSGDTQIDQYLPQRLVKVRSPS